jgi:hypothetical protein
MRASGGQNSTPIDSAHIIDLEAGRSVAWVSTNEWLNLNLSANEPERE